jgi:hypothetical protein
VLSDVAFHPIMCAGCADRTFYLQPCASKPSQQETDDWIGDIGKVLRDTAPNSQKTADNMMV